MGKRKASAPQRADKAKRQTLSWDMKDLRHDIKILPNEDPELLEEQKKAERLLEEIEKKANVLEPENEDSCPYETTQFELDEKLQKLVNSSEFFISVYDQLPAKPRSWSCKLGTFTLTICDNVTPKTLPSVSEFWIYVMENSELPYLVYFEIKQKDADNKDMIVYFEATSDMPHSCFKSLQWKTCQLRNYCMVYDDYHPGSGVIRIILYALEGSLTKLKFPSEGIPPKQNRLTLMELMSHFYGFTIQDLTQYPCNKKHDINAIYEEIRQRHINNLPALKVSVQHPNLKPRLRDYQKKAVVWMLTKEHYQCNHQADVNPETNDNLHMLYEEFQTLDGQTLYYNKYAGYLVQEKPLQCKSSPGGILADEMGLGKTVEVLSCILTHPRRGLPEIEPLPVIDNMESATDQQNLEKNDDELAIQDMLADPDYQMDIPDLNSSLNPVFDDLLNLDGTADLELGPQATATTSSNMDQQSRTNQQSHLSTSKSNHTEPDNGSTYLTNSVPGISTVEDDFSISVHRTEELTYRENAEPRLQTEIVGAHLEEHNYCLAHCDKDVTALQGTAISVSVDLDGSSAIFVSADVPVSTDVPANVTSDVHQYFTCTPDGVDQNTDQTSCSSAELALNNEVVINVSRDAYVNTDILQCTATEAHPDVDIFPSSSDIPPCNSEETVGSLNNTNVADELGGELCDALENVASDVHKTVEPEPKKEPVSETHTNHKRRTKARKNSSCDSKSHNKGNQKSPKKPCRKKSATATESEIQDPATQERESKESDKNFECICGERYIGDNYLSVECHMCGLLQHAKCVNYDLNDPCRGIYLCPHCRVIAPPIPSGATLIIAPRSISHQWVEEIQKHIQKESLKVLVYTGVHKMGFVQPQTLARQDIVILSYETLRKEIDYVDLPHSKSDTGRRFRNPKRFMAIPSPIVAVEWWRICLDEAQMVESVTTKTADMALRLKAVNRWCVTGTPIQKSLEDLYGLFVFLGVEPYWVHFWWTELLYKPFCHGQKEPLYSELVKTLWRTAKKDVLDQICLPTQTEEIHWLTFSPVEEHFYRRQYRECASEAMQKLSGWTNSETKLNSLDRTTLHQLLHPLVRLRQACCHPQAVRGEFLPIRKSTLTMEELLNQLVKKARIECEESHRQLVFAFNGLAALDIIQNNYAEAVDKYRSVLRSAEEHKPEIRTDELQLLHTLHNLHEILLTKPAGVPPTLRDSMLQEQAKEIKKKYIARFEQQVIQAQEAWDPVRRSLTEVTQQFKKGQHWWIELIQWATSINVDLQLVEKVKEDLADNREPDVQSMSLRFRNIKGLQYIVSTHLDELESTHHTLITFLKKLTKEPSVDLINKTVECCLRPADKILKTCPFCEADELFKSYESKLFSFVDKGVLEQVAEDDTHITVSARRQGTWADSECERALKTMLAFGKSWGGQSRFLEYGNLHIKMFDALKKEFKCLRTLWLYLRERVSAMDELDMATTRMRLRLPDELKPDVPQPNVLEPNEVEPQRMKLKSDQIIYRNELRRKLGQLLYLKNLAKAQTDFEGGQNPTLCPVCQRKLGTKWSVLQCGHCYCLECVRILVEQSGFGSNKRSLKCPLCRQRTHHADISYVSTRRKDDNQSNDDIKVKGDLSTKVEGIVHCLLSIRKREPQAKTLVFSTWTDVLDVLSTALYENNISFRSLHVCNKFQKNLDSFKHQNDVQVLLLPVQSGSNGLNLIEATHVILVEPILNLAQELQAIGRVHRIGQTRPTVVHRFLVRGTIEERMHYLLQNMQMPTNISNCEETTLTIGELCSLFSDQSSTHDLSDDADSDDNAGDDETNGNDSVVNRRIRDARLSENLH